MIKKFIFIVVAVLVSTAQLFAQPERRDKAVFIESKSEFWDSIQTTLGKFYKKDSTANKKLRVDFSQFNPPKSVDEFTKYWHNKPISQAVSGMCWCFSTTSFFESEIFRLSKREIKLSELYTVYWEYVEKARGYVQARSNQEFGEGSESDAVIRIWKNHGIVPADAYTGLLNGQPFHDHSKMFAELDSYLKSAEFNEEVQRSDRRLPSVLSNVIFFLVYC